VEVVEVQVNYISRIGPAAECLYQAVGHAGDAAQVHVAVGRYMADRFVGGNVGDRLHLDNYY
jgi:glycine/D-amino acid oxidase-like deaminating enzyme